MKPSEKRQVLHVETSYFLIFQNIVGTTKNIWNLRDIFKFYWVPFSTQSLQWNLALGSSLTCNIFSESWFLCSHKISYSKTCWRHSLLLCTIKKTKKFSEAARLITHFQDMSSITDTFEEFLKCSWDIMVRNIKKWINK